LGTQVKYYTVKREAARDLQEAMGYMRKWHAGLDIVRVELVGVIEMLSASPLNELVLLPSHVAASPMMPARASPVGQKVLL
jgi:hypothetical protein